MSGGEELARTALENNMMDRMDTLEAKVEAILNGNVRSGSLDMLVEDTDLIGYRLIAVPNDATQLEPTASDFTGAFLAGLEQAMFDATQDAWLAKINAGEVEFSVGIEGIYQNRLTNGYKHIADDGTTFRKGELGMTTLEGRTAPSFGLGYTENNGGSEGITNGGFETGSLTGWTTVSGSPTVSSGSEMDGKIGSYFVNIAVGDLISQTVNISASSLLTATVIAQTTAGSGGLTQAYLKYYTGANGTGTYIRTDTIYSNSYLFSVSTEKSFLAPSNAASVVLYLYTVNQTSYFDGVSLLDFGAGANNYFGFEPVNGKVVSTMFDDSQKRLGQVLVGSMNIPRVDEAKDKLTATNGAAGNVNVGTHGLVTTFVDQYGETDADVIQNSDIVVVTSAKTVALSTIPLGKWGTTARKVYGTVAGATRTDPDNYYLITTISDNTTTTGTYNISDATLVTGAKLPTVNTTGSRPAFPKHVDIPAESIITSVTNWAVSLNSALMYGYEYLAPAANANDGDEYNISFFCEAGTYTFTTLGRTVSNCGIVDYYLDNVLVTSGQDWYSASALVNIEKTFSITVPTSGYHHMLIKVNGKNASSSDYLFRVIRMWMKPAAY